MALYRLASQAGAGPARRAALLGAGLRADEALGCGLVDEIFESAEAACAELPRLVATLSRLPGPELAIRRRLVSDAASLTFDDALGAHLTACDRTLRRAAAPREHDQILAQI
jgi:isomerase DpgB